MEISKKKFEIKRLEKSLQKGIILAKPRIG
jgi:hypothetical protein